MTRSAKVFIVCFARMVFIRTNDSVFGCILISPRGKICLVQGRSTRKWSFPKGHPNTGESAFQCALRETMEETGILIPWQTHRPIKLSIGYYYVIFVEEEYKSFCNDAKEILQVCWVSIDELQELRGNVDVNAFLKKFALNEEEGDTLWKLIRRRCKGFGYSQRSQRCTLSCPTFYANLLE